MYSDKIKEIAENILEVSCFMFPLDEWELDDAELTEEPTGKVKAIVEFDGAAEGAMIINPSCSLLNALAVNMLGIDEAGMEEKEGALCEIANIICGNTVPVFSKDEEICVIKPPRILQPDETLPNEIEKMESASTRILVDEGMADIQMFYRIAEKA